MVRITHARRVGVVNTMNGRTNVTGGGSNGSLGGVIPLEAPSNFTVTPDNGKCLLTWTDPKDKYADELGEITDEGDQLVSQFAYTRIVRKQGSAPSSPNDGDLVTDSSTRNQYQSSAYVDDGLTNNTLYYYAAFTCNTDGVYSGAAVGSGTPKSYDLVFGNNTWEQIRDVVNNEIESSVWNIGDEIEIDVLGSPMTFVILDFSHDDLSDGSGKGSMTIGLKDVTSQASDMDARNKGYIDSTGHKWLVNNVIPSLDPILQTCIKIVSKTLTYCPRKSTGGGYTSGKTLEKFGTYQLSIFMLSMEELGINPVGNWYLGIDYTNTDPDGTVYPYYSTLQNRIKSKSYWTRLLIISDTDMHNFAYIQLSENRKDVYPTRDSGGGEYSINFAFCIGKTPS